MAPKMITMCGVDVRPLVRVPLVLSCGAASSPSPWCSRCHTLRSFCLSSILQAGGFVSVNTGGVPDANEIPIPKVLADEAFNSATCIGCGACVAACKNASAMLFVSAKVSQLALLPQGQPERYRRVQAMVAQMDAEGFGNCTNTGACEAECPKEISLTNIARMNRDYLTAKLFKEEEV